MEIKPKHEVTLSLWKLCIILSVTGIGWLTASYLFGEIEGSQIVDAISGLGIIISKALFIGSSVGIAINLYLKSALGDTPKAAMR